MMNHLTKVCVFSVLVLLLSTASFAAGEDGDLTLVDAVTKGVLRNPEYATVANNNLATKEELAQANALYAPSVDFVGDTGWERTDNQSVVDENLWRSRGSLTLTQLLFDGWGTSGEIKRQKARVASSAHRVGEVAEFVSLDIVQAYLELLRQRDLLSIARANVDDHMKILGTIETGASAGTVTEGDVAQAKARLAQARATTASTEQNLRSAEALFIQKVGDFPGTMAFPEIPRDQLPASIDDAVRAALTGSPTLAVYEADVKVAEKEYHSSNSTLYPRVELQANAVGAENILGVKGSSESESVLAVMKWNLYRGGADQARQREYMYRHAQAKERRAQSARQIEKDMRDTWAGMVAAGDRARQFSDQAEANEKVVSVYLDQFSLDRRTLLDVLDSQNELFVSRSNYVNSLYTEMFAVFRVLALEGKLMSTLGVQKPREARLEQ